MEGDLDVLRAYVQSLVIRSPAAQGAAIVENAGMSVKNARGPDKPSFAVKYGRVTGSARLYARAARGVASYEWEYSVDEIAWTRLPPTVRADTRVAGLEAGVTYSFRYRTLTKAGVGDWSDPVRLLMV